MTSRELAALAGCTEQNIRKLSKKAVEKNESFITIKGESYLFSLASSAYGKSYRYETLSTPTTPKKKEHRIGTLRTADLTKLSHIDLRDTKIQAKDKLLVVDLYRGTNYSYEAIVKGLSHQKGHFPSQKETAALIKKVSRWVDAFAKGGKKALEDKRGNKGDFRVVDE